MDQQIYIEWSDQYGFYEAKIGDAWIAGFRQDEDEKITIFGDDVLFSGDEHYRERIFDTVESAKEYVEDCTLGWLEKAGLIYAGVQL